MTGTGKSSLVNSIVGEYVTIESDSPRRETTRVSKHEKKIGDEVVTIYDSPGLPDCFKVEEQYLKELEMNCQDVNLNLYCVKMNDGMHASEEDAIVKLSCAFGTENFWQNTLIVLTFANEIMPPKSSHVSPAAYFQSRMSEWKTVLQHTLIEKVHVTREVAENVPIVPAGYSEQPSLPAANSDDWLGTLWLECLDRTKLIAKPIITKKGHEEPVIPPEKPKSVESFLGKLW
jgi:GTPase Era involved in 16S rRNA processing